MKDLIWMNRNEVGRIGVCVLSGGVCVCVHALCQTLQVGLYYTGRVMTLWIPYVSWEERGLCCPAPGTSTSENSHDYIDSFATFISLHESDPWGRIFLGEAVAGAVFAT